MAAMTSAFDVRRVAGWFRLIAFAEAVSWVGLLVGMYFKYLGSPQTEVGVKIFGPVHGGDLHRLPGGGVAGRCRPQVGTRHMVAGFAGQHRASRQCDLPHMG